MAKHDRRKKSGQPQSSQPVTIQVPLLGISDELERRFRRKWNTDFGGSGTSIPGSGTRIPEVEH